MSNTDAETLRQEISRTAGLLREIGSGSRLFRPPGGAYSRQSIESVLECDMKYVLWSWRQGHERLELSRRGSCRVDCTG